MLLRLLFGMWRVVVVLMCCVVLRCGVAWRGVLVCDVAFSVLHWIVVYRLVLFVLLCVLRYIVVIWCMLLCWYAVCCCIVLCCGVVVVV